MNRFWSQQTVILLNDLETHQISTEIILIARLVCLIAIKSRDSSVTINKMQLCSKNLNLITLALPGQNIGCLL